MDDLGAFDATGLAAAIANGELKARDAVEWSLRRIEECNPTLNAVVAVRADAALDEADAMTGPLAGVPFVVKSLGAAVGGLPLTNGSRLWADDVASEDSALVARYRRAGAVVVGMTNTPELGRNASTEPVLHGPTRNPHSPVHSAGGSSGGTAAAVASGMVPVGHGNDGGGSIRIPASACGLFGLKPSRGRTPSHPRRGAFAYPLGVNHVLARTVRDSALLLDIGAGALPGDPYVIAPRSRPYVSEVGAAFPRPLRVALTTTAPDGSGVDPACAAAATSLASTLASLGHDVVEAAPVWPLDALADVMRVGMTAPMAAQVDARLAELGRPGALADDDLEPFTRVLYEMGRGLSAGAFVGALEQLERAANEIGAFFVDHDLLVTPTLSRPTPPLGWLDTTDVSAMYERAGAFTAFTSPFNITGQPAASLPIAVDAGGLPVGAQLVAAFGREDLLLRVSAAVESATPWPTAPVLAADQDVTPSRARSSS